MKRKDKIIIIEYPFNKNWESILKEYIEKYNYEAVTINIKCKDYELIYDRLNERNNSINRHPAHSLKSYNSKYKNAYKSINELEYNKQKENYCNNKYTSIQLGETISFENNEENDIQRLISKLDEIIYEE